MKTIVVLLLAFMLTAYNCLQAQEKTTYISSYIDFPLTWSNASDNAVDLEGTVRFTPFFYFGNNLNIDFSSKAGFYAGWNVQNTGFIYDVDANTRKKVRNYYLGIPVGLKFGNLDKGFI